MQELSKVDPIVVGKGLYYQVGLGLISIAQEFRDEDGICYDMEIEFNPIIAVESWPALSDWLADLATALNSTKDAIYLEFMRGLNDNQFRLKFT